MHSTCITTAIMSETPTNSTNMTREEEEEEVRTLLERHQERIRLDLANTELLAVLVKNSVLTQSEEDLLLKPHNAVGGQTPSAPSSVGVTKRKLSAVISNASGTSSSVGSTTSATTATNNNNNNNSNNNSTGTPSRSASVVGDMAQSDNRSITPSLAIVVNQEQEQQQKVNLGDNLSDLYGGGGSTKDELTHHHLLNDADIIRLQCANLIEIIAKSGFEKFKQFCYAIENECPQLIEDLINDRLKCGKFSSFLFICFCFLFFLFFFFFCLVFHSFVVDNLCLLFSKRF